MAAKVDIAVACGQVQYSKWWGSVMGLLLQEQGHGAIEVGQIMVISSALPDFNKSNSVGGSMQPPAIITNGETALSSPEDKRRNNLTDANRGAATDRFMTGIPEIDWKADYLMWFDDDTVPPPGVISRLLAHDKPAIGGLYFNPSPPKNPIAYVKDKGGVGYLALYDYPYGALFQVDSIGMGCTLVHRSVYERIMEEHRVFVRPNGSLMPVHSSRISEGTGLKFAADEQLIDGYFVQRVKEVGPDDTRSWPFYALEYGRTEDHHFWELAANVGVRPWVDTTVVCGHIKPAEATYADYRKELTDAKSTRAG